MLAAIRHSDRKKVLAWDEAKSNRPFSCPRCADEAILKKGTIKVHHFAHKPPVTCEYGRGETERHRQCKSTIYEGLREHRRFREVEIEKGLGTVRPDVSACMNGIPIAIEVQISMLTMEQIIYRTSEYSMKGIYLLWLALYHRALETDCYSPRLWERWVHAAYFGRVYYWIGGLEAVPYHFGECIQYVGARSSDTADGDEELVSTSARLALWGPQAGGYKKRYKRFKTLKNGRIVSLANSFVPRHRSEPWRSKTLIVPESRLLMDTQRIWWQKDRNT